MESPKKYKKQRNNEGKENIRAHIAGQRWKKNQKTTEEMEGFLDTKK